MSEFKVTITGGRAEAVYPVVETSHDNTAANAAITALVAYKGAGLNTFPQNGDKLTVTVEPSDAGV